MNRVRITYLLALAGYFGLFATILVWNLGFRTDPVLPLPLVLGMLLIPLALPAVGLIRGRPYTHAWSTFLAIFFFVVGVWHSASMEERWYGLALGICSAFWFTGSMFYTRYKSRELRQQD